MSKVFYRTELLIDNRPEVKVWPNHRRAVSYAREHSKRDDVTGAAEVLDENKHVIAAYINGKDAWY